MVKSSTFLAQNESLENPNSPDSDREVTSARGRPALNWTLQAWRAAGHQVTTAQKGL